MLTETEKKTIKVWTKFARKLSKGDDKAYKLLEDIEPQEFAYILEFLISIIKKKEKKNGDNQRP
jgi:hypothetical protein